MAVFENSKKEMAAFESDLLENLTIQDGLIISAVYVVNAGTAECEQISELAQKHPLFVEKPAATSARVNKFTNLMQSDHSSRAVEAVTRNLKPEQRQQAFEFAMEVALADGLLTSKKKNTLQTLANKLELDNAFVAQKLANM